MSSEQSISRWIQEVKNGNDEAAEALWDRYFSDLVRVAEQKLQGIPCGVENEEDVAIRAFKSFFSAARQGRYPNLAGRDSLWRLLSKITKYKAIDVIRRRAREPVVSDHDLQFAVDDADPFMAAIMTEEVRRMLDVLQEPGLQEMALAKLANFTNEEVAAKQDCSIRTVERRLNLIREKWERHGTTYEPPS